MCTGDVEVCTGGDEVCTGGDEVCTGGDEVCTGDNEVCTGGDDTFTQCLPPFSQKCIETTMERDYIKAKQKALTVEAVSVEKVMESPARSPAIVKEDDLKVAIH